SRCRLADRSSEKATLHKRNFVTLPQRCAGHIAVVRANHTGVYGMGSVKITELVMLRFWLPGRHCNSLYEKEGTQSASSQSALPPSQPRATSNKLGRIT